MAKKEIERKGPQALKDEDLEKTSGGMYHGGGAWGPLPSDPRRNGAYPRNYKNNALTAEDQETSLKRMRLWKDNIRTGTNQEGK